MILKQLKLVWLCFLWLLVGIQSAQAVTTETSVDNLDNNAAAVADDDMGANSNNACIFNNSPVHPIEFSIEGSTPASTAYLVIQARDIDWPDEQNTIDINGQDLGVTVGENFAAVDGKVHTTLLEVPLQHIQTVNRVTINVDIGNELDPVWCADIQLAQLIIDDDGTNTGTADITALTTNQASYSALEPVLVNIDLLSISSSEQSVNLELTVRGSDNSIVQFESQQSITLSPNTTESRTWSFEAPAANIDSAWTIVAALYDANSGAFEGIEKTTFETLGATGAVPAPIVEQVIPEFAIEGEDNRLTIKGQNFILNDTNCTIGGVQLTDPVTIDNQSFKGTLIANALGNGSYSVVCSTSSGPSNSLANFIVAEAQGGGSNSGGGSSGGGSNSSGDNSSATGTSGSGGSGNSNESTNTSSSSRKKSSGGCAIGEASVIDPTLWIMLLFSLLYLRKRTSLKYNQHQIKTNM